MNTEIILKNDAAKSLLPDSYRGKINLSNLAVEINRASNLASTSLAKLKDVTSGSWINQAWNITDINRCIHDSLEAISTLSKAQIALQAITAEINQSTLDEQKIIAQQQQQLASQQHELAAHSEKIERLIILTDQSSLIDKVAEEINEIQSKISSIDPDKIVTWHLDIENKFDDINRLFGYELSKISDNLTHQVQAINDSIKVAEDKIWVQIKELSNDITIVKYDLFSSKQSLVDSIRGAEDKLNDQYNELRGNTEQIKVNFSKNIQTLGDAIKIEENKSDLRYEKFLEEIECTKSDLAHENIKNETNRIVISKLKTLIVALSFSQVCIILLILFFEFK